MQAESMAALETMKKHYRERYAFARQFREHGGRVVGYHYTSVPEELIAGAGFLPVMITGDPSIGTEAGDKYMEDYFCPFVRSVHSLYLIGRYDFLDLAIFTQTNDSIKRCYYYVWTVKELGLGVNIPPLAVFDSLHTRKYIASQYVRGRVAALKEKMEHLAGKTISEDGLRQTIEEYNENRMLLKEVAKLRRADDDADLGRPSLGNNFIFQSGAFRAQLLEPRGDDDDALHTRSGAIVHDSRYG